MFLSLAPAFAQEEYPPECVEDPSLCEDWTTIEEWVEMEEYVPAGGEEYPEECIEDPSLCADWTTVEEWNEMMLQQDAYQNSTEAIENYTSTGVACPTEVDWSNYAEVRVIQMRAGYSYRNHTRVLPVKTGR